MGPQKFLGPKQLWVREMCPKKIVRKEFWSEKMSKKIVRQESFWAQKEFFSNKFLGKTNSRSEENFGSKKKLSKKMFGFKNFVGS